jgi:hypothetical protein
MLTKVTQDNYFDCAQGIYWACVNWHSGQWSNLYRISCQLNYNPAHSESGPEQDTDAQAVYDELNAMGECREYTRMEETAQAYLDAIETAYNESH